MKFRYWEKPTLASEDVRFVIYIILGIPLAFFGFIFWIITLGWASPGKLIHDLAYWAVNGNWPK